MRVILARGRARQARRCQTGGYTVGIHGYCFGMDSITFMMISKDCRLPKIRPFARACAMMDASVPITLFMLAVSSIADGRLSIGLNRFFGACPDAEAAEPEARDAMMKPDAGEAGMKPDSKGH